MQIMDELKNILRTALTTVEEITSTNTPKRTETSRTGSEVNTITDTRTPPTKTSQLVGSTP